MTLRELGMRRLLVVAIGAISLAGCATAPVSAVASMSASPAATTTTPTPLPCPTASPLSVAEYVGADPACFGSANVEVAGWEGSVEGDGNGIDGIQGIEPAWLGAAGPSGGDALVAHLSSMPCQPSCSTKLYIHSDPASGLSLFEDDGRWVVVTGHRHDPAAASCHYVPLDGVLGPTPPPPSGDEVRAICDRAFVGTAVRFDTPPAAELAGCPTSATITLQQYRDSGLGCFVSRTMNLIAYAGGLPGMDFDGPEIAPSWLGWPAGGVWSVVPASSPDGLPACPDTTDARAPECIFMLVYAAPISGVAIPARHWVVLTGHIDDPAAHSCRYVSAGIGGDAIPPSAGARRACRAVFVVTHAQATPASTP